MFRYCRHASNLLGFLVCLALMEWLSRAPARSHRGSVHRERRRAPRQP